MFKVQGFLIKHGIGLGWKHDDVPLATATSCKEKQGGTIIHFLIAGENYIWSHGKKLWMINGLKGPVGHIDGVRQKRWSVHLGNVSLEYSPQMLLVDDTGNVCADYTGSSGEYDAKLERSVYVTGRSAKDTRFSMTGSTLFETLTGIRHPFRQVYGFADTNDFFDDHEMVLAVLLYDLIFRPPPTWNGP